MTIEFPEDAIRQDRHGRLWLLLDRIDEPAAIRADLIFAYHGRYYEVQGIDHKRDRAWVEVVRESTIPALLEDPPAVSPRSAPHFNPPSAL